MPLQILLPAGLQAQRHERPVPRSVGLTDRNVGDAREHEALPDGLQRALVLGDQHHGVRVRSQSLSDTLSSCMYDLRRLETSREVCAHDDVVELDLFRGFGGQPMVTVGESWRSCVDDFLEKPRSWLGSSGVEFCGTVLSRTA